MSATIRELLIAKAEPCQHKVRVLLIHGNPRQIVRQIEALEAQEADRRTISRN